MEGMYGIQDGSFNTWPNHGRRPMGMCPNMMYPMMNPMMNCMMWQMPYQMMEQGCCPMMNYKKMYKESMCPMMEMNMEEENVPYVTMKAVKIRDIKD